MQNFDKHDKLNPIEVKIDGNKILVELVCYQKLKYRFIVAGLLFSSAILNNTNTSCITCIGLNDTKQVFINSKLYRTLGVINLTQIKN